MKLHSLVAGILLSAAAVPAFGNEPVISRLVSFDPTQESQSFRQSMLFLWADMILQPGDVVRLMNSSLGKWADWTVGDLDNNPSTLDFILLDEGRYQSVYLGGGGSGGGAAGTYFFVSITWNSSWTTECSVGGQTISCDDETELN